MRDRAVTPKAAGVRGIFELVRLARAMSIHPTRQEALASWR